MAGPKKTQGITIPVKVLLDNKGITDLRASLSSLASGKDIKSELGKKIFMDIDVGAKIARKSITDIVNQLNKPIKNEKMAQSLGDSLDAAGMRMKTSFTNIRKQLDVAFKSVGNQEKLGQLRAIDNYITKLETALARARDLNKQSRDIGTKEKLSGDLKEATKEYNELSKKGEDITKGEFKRKQELLKVIDKINVALAEKANLEETADNILTNVGASGKGKISQVQNMITGGKTNKEALLTEDVLSKEDYQSLVKYINDFIGLVNSIEFEAQSFGQEVVKTFTDTADAADKANVRTERFKTIFAALGINFGLGAVISQFKQLINYSYTFIKQLDSALTEISIVTRMSRKEVQGLTSDFVEMAKKTGMSIDDVAKGAVIFFQQGLSKSEALIMTEISSTFAKVAGSTVERASDQLTAAVKGFGVAVTEAGSFADKLNVLAAESAASIDELATAMEKGASMAHQSGLSFDQYNAILSTMIEVTREAPENIGTSMKTIMARFQEIKESGTTEDGDTDVNRVETALKSVGVALRDDNNMLRDLGDVLDDLGPKWSSLDRNTQAYLGTIIAGTRQQSRFISLMQNWDRTLELTTKSEESAGAQAIQHRLAMESLESATTRLALTWQSLITKVVDSDFFKFFINSFTKVLELLSKGNVLLNVLGIGLLGFAVKLGTMETKQVAAFSKLEALLKSGADKFNMMIGDRTAAINSMIANATAKINEFKEAAYGSANKVGEGIQGDVSNVVEKGLVDNGVPTTGHRQLSLFDEDMDLGQQLTNSMQTGAVNAKKTFKDVFSELGTKSKNAFSNMTKGFQEAWKKPAMKAAIWGAGISIVGSMIESIVFNNAAEAEKASKALSTLKEDTDILRGTIASIDNNLTIYDELSTKIGKTADEQERLVTATEQLAEIMPEAVVGYDYKGNAIVDVSNLNALKQEKQQELLDSSAKYFETATESVVKNIEQKAENSYKDSGIHKAAGWGKAAGTAMMTVGAVTGVGAIAGGVVYGTSLLIDMIGKIYSDEIAVREEFVKELKALTPDFMKALSTINNATFNLSEDVYSNGKKASSEDRTELASRIASSYVNDAQEKMQKDFEAGRLSKEDLDERMGEIQDRWTEIAEALGSETLARLTVETADMQNVIDVNDMSWSQIHNQFTKMTNSALEGLDLSEKERASIEEGFKSAVFSGTSEGLYLAMQDIEKIKKELEKEGNDKANAQMSYAADGVGRYAGETDAEYGARFKAETEALHKVYAGELNKFQAAIENLTSSELAAYARAGVTTNRALLEEMLNEDSMVAEIKSAAMLSAEEADIAVLNSLLEAQSRIQAEISALGTNADKASEEYIALQEKAEAAATAIEKAWKNIPLAVEPSWEQLFKFYEGLMKRTDSIHKIINEVKEDGGVDVEGFKEIALLFDDIDFSAMNPEQTLEYAMAIQTVSDNLKVVNGEIQLNQQALEALGTIERASIQNKIDAQKQALETQKTELETRLELIDADIAYAEAKLKVAESDGTNIEAAEALSKARSDFAEIANTQLELAVNNEYTAAQNYVANWSSAYEQVADKYNKLLYARQKGVTADIDAAVKDLKDASELIKPVTESMKEESYGSKDAFIKALDNQIKAMTNARGELQTRINNIDLKLKTVWAYPQAVQEGHGKSDKAEKEVKEYISKLEKHLDLLSHIEREEVKLGHAQKLREMQTGRANTNMLQQQIKFAQHLLKDNQEMYRQYEIDATETATNIAKTFGSMITFFTDGSMEVSMDAYNKLGDEQKELFDEAIGGYKDLVTERDKYYDGVLSKMKEIRDYNQEIVNTYIEAENLVVEAVKRQEELILKTKLEAIDKEIEAIEKASEARRKAREDENNGKELAELQTSLQRAMMDSSGASASKVLELQKQIREKQQNIADTAFDRMVQDELEVRRNLQKMEQDQFDERLETMEYYWNRVAEIMAMGSETTQEFLKAFSTEYITLSDVQKQEMVNGWEDTFGRIEGLSVQQILETQEYVKSLQSHIDGLQTEINNTAADFDVLDNKITGTADTLNKLISAANNANTALNSVKPTGSSTTTSTTPAPTTNSTTSSSTVANPKQYGDYHNITANTLSERKQVYDMYMNLTKDLKDVFKSLNGLTGKSELEIMEMLKNKAGMYKMPYSMEILAESNAKIGGGQQSIYDLYKLSAYADGGMNYATGPAWLDGTASKPEAVLNALQTKHFIDFTNTLDRMYSPGQGIATGGQGSITIDSISFNVDSMSSIEDGAQAFDTFVDKFNEVGKRQGLKVHFPK